MVALSHVLQGDEMADFQHRHYAHVAALLAGGKPASNRTPIPGAEHIMGATVECAERRQWDDMVEAFADMFAQDNPNFVRSRFMDAATGNPTNKDRSTARRRMGFACGEAR